MKERKKKGVEIRVLGAVATTSADEAFFISKE